MIWIWNAGEIIQSLKAKYCTIRGWFYLVWVGNYRGVGSIFEPNHRITVKDPEKVTEYKKCALEYSKC